MLSAWLGPGRAPLITTGTSDDNNEEEDDEEVWREPIKAKLVLLNDRRKG